MHSKLAGQLGRVCTGSVRGDHSFDVGVGEADLSLSFRCFPTSGGTRSATVRKGYEGLMDV